MTGASGEGFGPTKPLPKYRKQEMKPNCLRQGGTNPARCHLPDPYLSPGGIPALQDPPPGDWNGDPASPPPPPGNKDPEGSLGPGMGTPASPRDSNGGTGDPRGTGTSPLPAPRDRDPDVTPGVVSFVPSRPLPVPAPAHRGRERFPAGIPVGSGCPGLPRPVRSGAEPCRAVGASPGRCRAVPCRAGTERSGAVPEEARRAGAGRGGPGPCPRAVRGSPRAGTGTRSPGGDGGTRGNREPGGSIRCRGSRRVRWAPRGDELGWARCPKGTRGRGGGPRSGHGAMPWWASANRVAVGGSPGPRGGCRHPRARVGSGHVGTLWPLCRSPRPQGHPCRHPDT